MKFTRRIGNLFVPLKARKLSEIEIKPGDVILSHTDDGHPYGVCGAVYATQVDKSRQIEDQSKLSLEK